MRRRCEGGEFSEDPPTCEGLNQVGIKCHHGYRYHQHHHHHHGDDRALIPIITKIHQPFIIGFNPGVQLQTRQAPHNII